MNLRKIFNNTKPALLIAAALLFSGLSAFAADEAASAKSLLDSLSNVPVEQLTADLPTPLMRAVEMDETSRGNANCTPSAAIMPGRDFSPKIDDAKRTTAIIALLEKISTCKPLPYSQDGVVNLNKEGQMPQAPKGFYREYTLIVPGRKTGDGAEPIVIGGKTIMSGTMQSARGPERIIIGGGEKIYYTPDHYKTSIELKIVK